MKQSDLDDLKSLLRQYRKARTVVRQAAKLHKDTSEPEKKRDEIFYRMVPHLKTIGKESKAFRDPFLKIVVRTYYFGKSAREIAETYEFTEQYIFKLLRKADRIMVTESEKST